MQAVVGILGITEVTDLSDWRFGSILLILVWQLLLVELSWLILRRDGGGSLRAEYRHLVNELLLAPAH